MFLGSTYLTSMLISVPSQSCRKSLENIIGTNSATSAILTRRNTSVFQTALIAKLWTHKTVILNTKNRCIVMTNQNFYGDTCLANHGVLGKKLLFVFDACLAIFRCATGKRKSRFVDCCIAVKSAVQNSSLNQSTNMDTVKAPLAKNIFLTITCVSCRPKVFV